MGRRTLWIRGEGPKGARGLPLGDGGKRPPTTNAFTSWLFVRSDHKTSQILVSSYLLHLLDCQWQDYDFTLISDLQLPEFLIRSAVSKLTSGREGGGGWEGGGGSKNNYVHPS